MTSLVEIPFHGTTIHAINDEGKPLVSVSHVCDSLGIDAKSQRRKLSNKSWATRVMMTSVAEDGKTREMFMVDRRTLTMWLATIDTNRVGDSARALLEAFQNEAADVLDSYFHEGGVINPGATPGQLDRLAVTIRSQGEALQALAPFLSPKFLESKAKILAARALGEEPEIDPLDMPLQAEDYLRDKGLKGNELKSVRSTFGRRVSLLYKQTYDKAPEKSTQEVGGSIRTINSYTQRDRGLFDQVWEDHYADLYEPSLMEELENA